MGLIGEPPQLVRYDSVRYGVGVVRVLPTVLSQILEKIQKGNSQFFFENKFLH